MNPESVRIWGSKGLRDPKCLEKDAITRPIVGSLRVSPDFRCILMPCLHGVEMELLKKKKHCVTSDRMHAIERIPWIHRALRKAGRVTVTPRPMDAHLAIDHIEPLNPTGVDFVYGDFLGQPDFTHAEFLYKLFALRLIRPGGKLLLTFGLTRCRSLVKEFNAMLMKAGKASVVPTRHYIDVAIELAGHRPYRKIAEHPYTSQLGNTAHRYMVTEVDF